MREAADCEREALMQLVSFKWLMSGKGWSVDVRRIQDEPAYADSCLRRGAASDLEILLLALDCLQAAQVPDLSVDLADASIVRSLLSGVSISRRCEGVAANCVVCWMHRPAQALP